MMGKKEQYRRWEYSDEMEVNVEEQLTLGLGDEETTDDPDGQSTTTFTTFTEPSVILSLSRTPTSSSFSHNHNLTWIKQKLQLVFVWSLVLVVGFVVGLGCGTRETRDGRPTETPAVTGRISHSHSTLTAPASSASSFASPSPPSNSPPNSQPWNSHELNESTLDKLIAQINAENIRHNLKRMSQEVHRAGSPDGHSMAMAVRDLWRTYGLSVRVEQHKALITRTTGANMMQALDVNGSVLFRSSEGDDMNLRNARPFMAFSPPADLTGTLIYGHYGTHEDFGYLEATQIPLNGSIALLRFGPLHPSNIVAAAVKFGVAGLIFYPDPAEFGPMMPSTAFRRSSLLTMKQILEYQERTRTNGSESERKLTIPSHTISSNDAEYLFRLMKARRGRSKMRKDWEGGLKTAYSFGGSVSLQVHLRLFNEEKASSIYNVVAAIPGAWESDRYVMVGSSHDSWTYGAGDPGVGLALLTEIARVFASSVGKGWKTRRSILFISWDANLFANQGVQQWLQEHYFEISSRAVAYIDLTRVLQGNQTLRVHCSPVLREVTKKAIARVKHFDLQTKGSGGAGNSSSSSSSNFRMGGGPVGGSSGGGHGGHPPSIDFSSTVSTDQSSFAFFGNLGIPFIRPTVLNSPKEYDYPLFHTSFDTFENFRRLVDPTFKGAETMGRIISALILLLADSSLLPINVEDYVEEIQKAFGNFMAHYQTDLHHANLSIAYLQAAVMRLEVIGDNFRTEIHNRSVIINNEHEHEPPLSRQMKTKKLLFHRIINDKLMGLDRAFLSRRSEPFKHLILGYSSCSWMPSSGVPPQLHEIPRESQSSEKSDFDPQNSNNFHFLDHDHDPYNCSLAFEAGYNFHFPKLRVALHCGRRLRKLSEAQSRLRNQLKKQNQEKQFQSKFKKPVKSVMIDEMREERGKVTRKREEKEEGLVERKEEELLGEECANWKREAADAVTGLIRALDAAAASLQSPLLPEESDSAAVT